MDMSNSSGQRNPKQNLCQNQVENLLKAMESVETGVGKGAESSLAGVTDPTVDRVRPPQIDSELLAAVQKLHQSAACELAELLSSTLRTPVEVTVANIGTVLMSEFHNQAQEHRWHSVLSPESVVGDWHLDVTPELCCVMVDRMLGGEPTAGETFDRPMTEIERRLMGRVVEVILETLQRTWQQVTDLRWFVRHDLQVRDDQDQRSWMVQIRFSIALCRNQGTVRLCLPQSVIEDFRGQLCHPSGQLDAHVAGGLQGRVARNLAAAPIDVVATLAKSTIRTDDLLDLNVGDIIATEQEVDGPLELSIQNVPKFKVRAGALRGKKAIQIEGMADQADPQSAPATVPTKDP
jgi:flagellar motor switch protein FliM